MKYGDWIPSDIGVNTRAESVRTGGIEAPYVAWLDLKGLL